MEEESEENKESDRGKKHFVYANEKGKAEAQALKLATWVLSILPLSLPLSLPFSLSTSPHLALASLYPAATA